MSELSGLLLGIFQRRDHSRSETTAWKFVLCYCDVDSRSLSLWCVVLPGFPASSAHPLLGILLNLFEEMVEVRANICNILQEVVGEGVGGVKCD